MDAKNSIIISLMACGSFCRRWHQHLKLNFLVKVQNRTFDAQRLKSGYRVSRILCARCHFITVVVTSRKCIQMYFAGIVIGNVFSLIS